MELHLSTSEAREEPLWDQAAPRDVCRRCGARRAGEFCSRCGQREARRLSLRRTFGETLEHVASLDSALLRTLIGLSTRPGTTIRRYIAGDRSGLASPAKYAFLAATLYALVINLFEIDVRPAGARSGGAEAEGWMRLIVSLLAYLIFLYLLPAAAVLRLCYRRYGPNFAESYVTLLYFAGQYLLAATFLAALGTFSLDAGFWIVRGVGCLILLWILAELFRASIARTILTTVAVYLLVVLGGMVAGVLTLLLSFLVPAIRPG